MSNVWHDKAKWHYDSAFKKYCKKNNVAEDALSEEQSDQIFDFSCTHIGIFWMWIVLHHFESEFHRQNEQQDAINRLRNKKITGNEYLTAECDCQLAEDDISEEALPFVKKCYDIYIGDYEEWLEKNRGGSIYQIPCTWELYEDMEPMLDRLFEQYKSDKLTKGFWARFFHF